MNGLVVPTFRRSGFWRVAQPFWPPWGVGTPGTCYVLRSKGDYDVQIQDASNLTSGRASIQSKRPPRWRRQRGGSLLRDRVAWWAYVDWFPQRMDHGINQVLWGLRKKLTPTTLTGKLAGAAALGGAATSHLILFLFWVKRGMQCPFLKIPFFRDSISINNIIKFRWFVKRWCVCFFFRKAFQEG